MSNAGTTEPLREAPGHTSKPVPPQDAALLAQAGEYSLIQLEALAGIALKQATRRLRLSSTTG